MSKVWLIYSPTDSNDPSPSLLGAWSTQALAEQERDRLIRIDALKKFPSIYEIEDVPLDEPWND